MTDTAEYTLSVWRNLPDVPAHIRANYRFVYIKQPDCDQIVVETLPIGALAHEQNVVRQNTIRLCRHGIQLKPEADDPYALDNTVLVTKCMRETLIAAIEDAKPRVADEGIVYVTKRVLMGDYARGFVATFRIGVGAPCVTKITT